MTDARFGVFTGTRSYGGEGFEVAVLRTTDGLTHHILVVEHTKKWLRYVLRHDQKEYLLVSTSVEVLLDEPITCVICLAKGPEEPSG